MCRDPRDEAFFSVILCKAKRGAPALSGGIERVQLPFSTRPPNIKNSRLIAVIFLKRVDQVQRRTVLSCLKKGKGKPLGIVNIKGGLGRQRRSA